MSDEVKTPEVMLREVEQNVMEKLDAKLDAKLRTIADDLARPRIEVVSTVESELRAMKDAMVQKRAITINGSGAYNVLNDIVKVIITKYDLLSKVRFEYGPNAQTNIPVLSTRPARPAKQVEGATGIGSDATAVLGATTIAPACYFSTLPVSAEALLMSGANIESRLPGIFADAFADAMMYGMISGDSTMLGMFANASLTVDSNCAAAGAPTLADIIKFAGALKAKAHDPSIIIAPDFVSNFVAETTAESAALKYALLQDVPRMRGVTVYESGYAPATYVSGDVVAVGMDLSNYVIAMAAELRIKPKEAVGDTNTYFEGTMFFNGKPILAANGFQLKAV